MGLPVAYHNNTRIIVFLLLLFDFFLDGADFTADFLTPSEDSLSSTKFSGAISCNNSTEIKNGLCLWIFLMLGKMVSWRHCWHLREVWISSSYRILQWGHLFCLWVGCSESFCSKYREVQTLLEHDSFETTLKVFLLGDQQGQAHQITRAISMVLLWSDISQHSYLGYKIHEEKRWILFQSC